MTSKGLARKAYLIITFVITVPLCIAFYYYSEHQKNMILNEDEKELIRISLALSQRISQSDIEGIYWRAGDWQKDSLAQKVDLTKNYQPLVDEIAMMYPKYKMGIYHHDVGRAIALYPPSAWDWFIFENHPAVQKMYQTGQAIAERLVSDKDTGSTPMVAVAPVYCMGRIAGYTWVSKDADQAVMVSRDVFSKGLTVCFFVWLVFMLIVWAVFQRFEQSLQHFSHQLATNGPVEFQDFPQLEPLLATIVQLRDDITKETEHYLEESRTLKKLIELVPMAIFLVDKQGIIKSCNQAFLRYYPEYTPDSIINVPYADFAARNKRNLNDTVVMRALAGEEVHNEYEFFLNRYWLSHALPLRDQERKINGAIAICHDITEHEKLRREMIRLDRLNIVGQMAASVAHEVRNPMTVARGYLQTLIKKTGKMYTDQFQTIIEELDRANHIISDFLSLARDKYVEKEKKSLREIVENLFPLVESEALARNINCTVDLERHLPLLLLNPEEIKQLILNLAMNALDAMEGLKAGRLTISCLYNQQHNEVELKICDNGCGMSQAAIDKAFEPFFTTKKNGSGLGLSVCKSIVERHGGQIRISSFVGQGSDFIVSFPVMA